MRKKIEVTLIPRTSNNDVINRINQSLKKVFVSASASNQRGEDISNLFSPAGDICGEEINYTFCTYPIFADDLKKTEAAIQSIVDKVVSKLQFKTRCNIDQIIKIN